MVERGKRMRVLFLGAHTDDEISTAGTLTKLREKGHEIYLAVFSFCEESSEALGCPRNVLEREFAHSMKILKLDSENVFLHHYRVRHFSESRQEILEDLVVIRKLVKPHLVFIPNTMDMHQDHRTISEEGKRAFKEGTLLGYESPRSLLSGCHICYVRLNTQHIFTKIECLHRYESQKVRPGMNVDIRESLAKVRGAQAKHIYAEAFEVIRLYF